MVWLNNINLAKNPAKIGIPAIDNNDAVKIAAIKGLVFPKPLKLTISSLSLFLVTKIITANEAIPAKA